MGFFPRCNASLHPAPPSPVGSSDGSTALRLQEPPPLQDIESAHALLVLGDAVTTDHISPAGSIARTSPAARYLIDMGSVAAAAPGWAQSAASFSVRSRIHVMSYSTLCSNPFQCEKIMTLVNTMPCILPPYSTLLAYRQPVSSLSCTALLL